MGTQTGYSSKYARKTTKWRSVFSRIFGPRKPVQQPSMTVKPTEGRVDELSSAKLESQVQEKQTEKREINVEVKREENTEVEQVENAEVEQDEAFEIKQEASVEAQGIQSQSSRSSSSVSSLSGDTSCARRFMAELPGLLEIDSENENESNENEPVVDANKVAEVVVFPRISSMTFFGNNEAGYVAPEHATVPQASAPAFEAIGAIDLAKHIVFAAINAGEDYAFNPICKGGNMHGGKKKRLLGLLAHVIENRAPNVLKLSAEDAKQHEVTTNLAGAVNFHMQAQKGKHVHFDVKEQAIKLQSELCGQLEQAAYVAPSMGIR